MKRLILPIVLLSVALAGAYGFVVTRWEANYRELLQVGDAAAAAGDFVSAIEAFSGAVALKPDSMAAHVKRGEAYWRRGDLESAARDLRRAVDLDPSAPRPRELLGDVSYALGRYERAADHYREYVELDDSAHRLFYKLGLAQYRAGAADACIAALDGALALDARSAETHYLRGLCLRDAQKPRDAVAALEQAVALSPAMLQGREELADVYGELGRADARLAQLDALRALDPGPSREVALGLAHAQTGDATGAVQVLSRAARLYPAHRYTYVALGRVWLDVAAARDDRIALNKAIEALQNATGMEDNGEALMLSGRALLLAGDVEAAERALQQASEKLPVEPAVFPYLADAAERLGHLEVAREALIDFDSLAPDAADPRRAARVAGKIAELSMRLDDPLTALHWYGRRAATMPPDAPLLVRMAEAHLASGNPQGAKTAIEQALALDPANTRARALSRKISQ